MFAVFESFKDYVATEQLDGDNKYDAGEHGLQVRLDRICSCLCYLKLKCLLDMFDLIFIAGGRKGSEISYLSSNPSSSANEVHV